MQYRVLKKLLRFCVLSGALLSLIYINAGAAAAADFVSVKKNGVRLRSGPGTKYEVLFELPSGYPLKVLKRREKWLKVADYERDKGWIYAGLVSKAPYVIVTVDECNIRSGPGTNYDKVGKAVRDVILKIQDREGDWLKIQHPELTGWIYRKLVWPQDAG
ncbi:MAG: SH3 domain-containing protein [Candidatus Electrothrix sp. YB6]